MNNLYFCTTSKIGLTTFWRAKQKVANELLGYSYMRFKVISYKIIMSKSEYFVNLPKCFIIRLSFNQYNTISLLFLCAQSFKKKKKKNNSTVTYRFVVCRHNKRFSVQFLKISLHLLTTTHFVQTISRLILPILHQNKK